MTFAALSTVIAVFENIVAMYIDGFNMSRKKAVAINIPLMAVLSLPAVLGYNVLSFIQPLGAGSTIMDLEDFFVSNNLLPLGSLVSVMFCTSNHGWGWADFVNEVNTGEGLKFPEKIRFYMTYILPLIIIFVYLKGYYDMFSDKGTVTLAVWMFVAVLLLAITLYFGMSKRKIKGNHIDEQGE
jgi:NSS family neurotransmitter:Na+ symporter